MTTQQVEELGLETLVKSALSRSATITELLGHLADAYMVDEGPVGEVIPLPVEVTDAQRVALARLPEVYGRVTPRERRVLDPFEVEDLVEERVVLDELKKLVEVRHESIRTTVFNHLDVEAERGGDAEGASRDRRGHYVLPGEVYDSPSGRRFTREVRSTTPRLDASMLKAIAEDPDSELSHEDYLSMTTQTRVVDENKVMLALKRNPSLVGAISKALTPGTRSASLWLRKG